MYKKKYSIDMCSGPILPKLLRLVLPLMLSSILQLLFHTADIIVVGNFAGENSLAAVGSTGSLVNMMTNLFLGLSVGTNVLTARYLGAKDSGNVSRTVHTAISMSLISGVILTLIGVIFAEKLLLLMQSPPEVLSLSALYLRIYFLGMIPMLIYNFGSSILRAKGDTKRPLYFLTIAGVVNVALNLIFVIVWKMDVAGVALATVISQCISAIFILICLAKETDGVKFSPKKLQLEGKIVRRILQVGIPAGLEGVVFSLSNVVLQSSVNSFGAIVMAGCAAAASIEGFVWMAMNAFSQGTLTFISQNMGAGKYGRINKILRTSLLCSGLTGLVLGNLAYLFGGSLVRIYDPRPEVVVPALTRMMYVGRLYFLCGLMDIVGCTVRGMGHPTAPTIVSLLGACGLRLLWILTLFQLPQFHTRGFLFMSYPVSWMITLLAHITCFVIFRKRYPKEDAPSPLIT